jgi:plasmid maintenance system antidote protein VapI
MKQIGEGGPYRSLSHFLLEAMGLGHKQQSHMFSIISGRRVMTVDAAAKITAAVDGKPTASAPKRSRALIVAPKTEPRAERASRDELASLRLDVGHVLATRFGGSAPAMARELGITAARLAKFLDGGTLTTDVTSDITRRLAALGTLRPTALLSTIRGAAISIEAWRDGSVQGELEPPELRARKLVEKWGTEAIAMVLQLAGGGAA